MYARRRNCELPRSLFVIRPQSNSNNSKSQSFTFGPLHLPVYKSSSTRLCGRRSHFHVITIVDAFPNSALLLFSAQTWPFFSSIRRSYSQVSNWNSKNYFAIATIFSIFMLGSTKNYQQQCLNLKKYNALEVSFHWFSRSANKSRLGQQLKSWKIRCPSPQSPLHIPPFMDNAAQKSSYTW